MRLLETKTSPTKGYIPKYIGINVLVQEKKWLVVKIWCMVARHVDWPPYNFGHSIDTHSIYM